MMENLRMENKYLTNYLQIAVDPQKGCLVQIWTGYCTPEEFREGQQKSLDLFVENHCVHFVSDTTNACPLRKEDLDWVSRNITPKLRDAGMSVINFVLSSSAYTRLTLEMLEEVDRDINNIPMRYFGSLECALDSI
jgi:hypothetical protein